MPNLTDGAVIEAIQIAGNRAVSIEAIVAKIQTKAGDKINTAAIKRDMASVRAYGVRNNSLPLLSNSTMDDEGASSAIPLS